MINSIENLFIESAILPIDTTGAAQTGRAISLKNYGKCLIVLGQGAWAGGTSAITIEQGTGVAMGDAKALGFSYRYTKVAGGDTYTKTAVSSDTFPLPAVANTMNVIEIDASSLDVANGFDCIRIMLATPGANADLVCGFYILLNPRYASTETVGPNAD